MTDNLAYERSPHTYKVSEYEQLLFHGLKCQADNSKDIAIVGSGMSGLVSGWLLKNAGHRVQLFEASNIVGGRIRTLRDRFTGGFYAEAGAMRIPSHHGLTSRLLDELDLKKANWDFPNFNPKGYYYFNNRHVRMEEYESDPNRLRKIFKVADLGIGKSARQLLFICLLNYIESEGRKTGRPASPSFMQLATDIREFSLKQTASDSEAERALARWRHLLKQIDANHEIFVELDKFSLRQFLHEGCFLVPDRIDGKLSPEEADHICTVLSIDLSLSSSLASVLRSFYNIYNAEVLHQIEGGMDQLPRAFVESFSGAKTVREPIAADDLHYNSRVKALTRKNDNGRIRVVVQRPSGDDDPDPPDFDLVIVALPFTALRHVRMYDLASPEKRRAVRQLHYDNACKILMEFRHSFWKYGPYNIIGGGRSVSDLPIRQTFYPNKNQNQERVLLASYTWGEESMHWTALDHEQRLRFALRDLSLLHKGLGEPDLRRIFVGGMSHNWIEDENTAGAFAFFEPYQGGTLFQHIWRPEGRVHYCGEHTSTKPGWIEGAVESGVRVADEICRRLAQDPDLIKDDGRTAVYHDSGGG